MDWQLLTVALIVTGALWYLGRSTWQSLRPGKSGCGGGCGCGAGTSPAGPASGQTVLIPPDRLLDRLRQPPGS